MQIASQIASSAKGAATNALEFSKKNPLTVAGLAAAATLTSAYVSGVDFSGIASDFTGAIEGLFARSTQIVPSKVKDSPAVVKAILVGGTIVTGAFSKGAHTEMRAHPSCRSRSFLGVMLTTCVAFAVATGSYLTGGMTSEGVRSWMDENLPARPSEVA